jgi:hypothetical protein
LSPNIEEIILSDCVSLVHVYSSSFLNKLNRLCLDGCTKLKSLNIPSNILSRSSGLVALRDYHNLETILISSRTNQVVQSIKWSYVYGYLNYNSIRVFHDTITQMSNDEGGYMFWENHSITFTSINELCWLDISNCESLTYLPAELLNLKFLRRLSQWLFKVGGVT